jgi:hypothetical protein
VDGDAVMYGKIRDDVEEDWERLVRQMMMLVA